jgi:hypothetical protein
VRTVLRVQAIAILAAAVLTGPLGATARAADECLSHPNLQSPLGSHWYYRIDRGSNRRCWYLGSQGFSAHRTISATWHPTTNPRSHAKAMHEERSIAKASRVVARKDTIGPEIFAAVWPGEKASVGPLAQEPSEKPPYSTSTTGFGGTVG